MAARWSLRKSGEIMTTIKLDYHVSKKLVKWVMEKLGVSERQAILRIKEKVSYNMPMYPNWAYHAETNSIEIDDLEYWGEHSRKRGDEVFDDPFVECSKCGHVILSSQSYDKAGDIFCIECKPW